MHTVEPIQATEPIPAVEVVVGAELVDLASGLLWGAGVSAVAEHPVDDAAVLLRTDVPAGGVEAVRRVLAGLVPPVAVTVVEVVDDGLDAWRDHARVVAVGRRLVVRPPWLRWDGAGLRPPDGTDDGSSGAPGAGFGSTTSPRSTGRSAPGPIVIELDPSRSWGHGAHPTTRLCLAEVERLLDERPALGVIDVGCGSGVLSVAAALLGAAWVEACDIDEAAIEATVANAERNGVTDRVRAHLVPPDQADDPLRHLPHQVEDPVRHLPRQVEDPVRGPGRQADLIVANIGAAALVALAPRLVNRLGPGGTLVLSGLLDPPPPEVLAAYRPLAPTVTALDGWVALTLTSHS